MKQQLQEGLMAHDLDDLVLPMLTIDQYESKISDEAIVVGFYVFDEEPAFDLSLFIEKGVNQVLDTEVSPAPTEDGYYVCFVEFNRTTLFPQQLLNLIENINNVTNVKNWQFQSYRSKKIHDLSKTNLEKFVRLQTKPKKAKVKEWLKTSTINKFETRGKQIQLNQNPALTFEFVAFGPGPKLFESHGLNNKSFDLDQTSKSQTNLLLAALGSHYNVDSINQVFAVTKINDQNILLLKKI